MPERRKRRTLRRRARHDAVAALDLTRGIDRRRARRRRDVRYARAMNTYRTCSKRRRRHRARRRRRGAPSVTSRRVFFSTAPRALRAAIASKPSAAAAGAALARRHARPSAPRASSDRSEPRDARAAVPRTVARLAFAPGTRTSIRRIIWSRVVIFSPVCSFDRSRRFGPRRLVLVPPRHPTADGGLHRRHREDGFVQGARAA